MLVPVVVALRRSPAKKPPIVTVAPTSAVLSESHALTAEITETGVLCDAAELSVLSVNVAPDVNASVGALSSAMPAGAAPLEVDRKCVGVVDSEPPIRPPT